MTTPDGYRRVSVGPERADDFLNVDQWAFAFTPRENRLAMALDLIPIERARAMEVTDPSRGNVGELVAVHSSFEFQMCVPGGRLVPTAGLTWVGVHTAHRRRGLLTEMIRDHFARSLERREVVSTLYAAEEEIYQRFGYGRGAHEVRLTIPRSPTLREVPGSDHLVVRLESLDEATHTNVILAVQSRLTRPGTVPVPADRAVRELFLDYEEQREGAEQNRIATVWDGDDPVAFAIFRRKLTWNPSGPEGKNSVAWTASLSAQASRRLWSVLTDMDLMATTETSWLAPDDPIVNLLADLRGAKPTLSDNLWVRVLEVKGALEGRGYAADCDVVLEVADKQIPDNAGLWRLRVVGGEATVERADAGVTPDLRLAVQELGATYLGGVSVAALAKAGLVEEVRPGAASELAVAMRSEIAPVANFPF